MLVLKTESFCREFLAHSEGAFFWNMVFTFSQSHSPGKIVYFSGTGKKRLISPSSHPSRACVACALPCPLQIKKNPGFVVSSQKSGFCPLSTTIHQHLSLIGFSFFLLVSLTLTANCVFWGGSINAWTKQGHPNDYRGCGVHPPPSTMTKHQRCLGTSPKCGPVVEAPTIVGASL